MPGLSERREHSPRALPDLSVHLLQQRKQLLVMDQNRELLFQLLFLAGLELQRLDLRHRVREQVRTAEALALVSNQFRVPLPQRGEGGIHFVETLRKGLGSGPTVHEGAVILEIQQRLVLVLAVHVEQMRAELVQVRTGHRGGLDEEGAAPAGLQHPSEYDPAFVGADPARGQPGRGLRVVPDGHDAGHGGFFRSGPYDGGIGLVAQEEPESADEDGLAGTGLTAEDVQTRGELDGQLVDDGEVVDVELLKHSAPPPS